MAEDGAWPSLCLGPPSQRLGEQIRVPCGEDPWKAGNPGGLRRPSQVCPGYEASGTMLHFFLEPSFPSGAK